MDNSYSNRKTWDQAEAICQGFGSHVHLATIDTQDVCTQVRGSGLGLIQHKSRIGSWFQLHNHGLTFDCCLIIKHENIFIH